MSDEQQTPEAGEEPFDRAMRILREPFPESAIGLLPRQVRKDDQDKGKCENTPQGRHYSRDGLFCGGYHALSVHLSYVGHAATTDRLLKADPFWNWEPVATDANGLPLIVNGGLWIRLTVAGITRLGYGDAPGKRDATKELIGDALRNAAMRFGVALDLWSKEDLQAADEERGTEERPAGAESPRQSSSGRTSAPAGSGAPAAGRGSSGGRPVDEEVRAAWRQRILAIEYLGNKPKEKGPDGGLRTAYADATREQIVNWAVVAGEDETFLQLLQRLSRELPEWPDESGDAVPPDEDEAQRVERLSAEAERAARDRPMALGGGSEDPWANVGEGESGWGNTGAGA